MPPIPLCLSMYFHFTAVLGSVCVPLLVQLEYRYYIYQKSGCSLFILFSVRSLGQIIGDGINLEPACVLRCAYTAPTFALVGSSAVLQSTLEIS